MYKRDLIAVEIQKLAEVLAKILGLKTEGKSAEAELLFKQVMEERFNLSDEAIGDADKFNIAVKAQQMGPEKIDMLAKFLFSSLASDSPAAFNALTAKKLQHLFNILEFEHHIINLENMERQRVIQKYL